MRADPLGPMGWIYWMTRGKLASREWARLRAENKRLRAALKPIADEIDLIGLHGSAPPRERMLMFTSEGGGTFLGIDIGVLYDAHTAYQQKPKNGES